MRIFLLVAFAPLALPAAWLPPAGVGRCMGTGGRICMAAQSLEELWRLLDAAVEAEDYAEATRLKGRIDRALGDPSPDASAGLRSSVSRAAEEPSSEPARDVFRFDTATMPASQSEQVAEWDDDLQARVLRQMVAAFDNYSPVETEGLLNALVVAAAGTGGAGDQAAADAERSLLKLSELTIALEALEQAVRSRAAPIAVLEDECRTLRSQVRMWGRDGERRAPGTWLNWLDSIKPD